MKSICTHLAFLTLVAAPFAHAADTNINISNAGVQVTGATTLRLNNVHVEGATTPVTMEFGWDPKTGTLRVLSKAPDTNAKWRLAASKVKYNPDTGTFAKDLSGLCSTEFGFGNVYADWADVKEWIANDPAKAQAFINSVGLTPPGPGSKFVLASYQMRPFSSMTSPTDTHYLNGITREPAGARDNVLGGTVYVGNIWAYGHVEYQVLCNNKSAP